MSVFPLEFAVEEYQRRIEATLVRMAEQELDALLLFNQESMYYLYGYDQVGYWVYQVVVVPADGSAPVAICRAADEHLLRSSLIQDVRVWLDDSQQDPCRMTADVLRDRGLLNAGAVIGLEMKSHALQAYHYDRLHRQLRAHAAVRDASDLVTGLRVVKSAAEIEYMRRAGTVLAAGFDVALGTLRIGIRERDLHAAIVTAMHQAGGDAPALPPPIASGARTLSQTHAGATDRTLCEGDTVTIEIGGAFRRYHAVGLRTVCIGHASREVRATYDVLRDGLAAGYGVLRPGASVAAVARAVLEAVEARGVSRRGRHVGYGIGIGYPPTWVDNLRIKETDPHVLRPGMCFYFYAGARVEDRDLWVGVGDPVIVTDGGHETLTEATPELPVL